ncbi:FAD-dependent oxidoreductase [Streptomyces sp. NPDC096339]|uniref:FAD-dependent oxidoreductase n=1 Tax=Streptomyces sp. NPDC096339 TaxID=3366086 RepID=UPI003802092F
MHQGDFAVSVYARRSVIVGAGAVAAGLAVPQVAQAVDPGSPPPSGKVENSPSVVVPSSDPRYAELQLRNWNKLYKANPEYFRIVRTPYQVNRAVADAYAAGKRIAVRSGGHGLAGLVEDPANQVVIDFSEMRSVTYDDTMEAFCIEPGATLGQIYRNLDYGWGVTLPAGTCPAVGAGGHIIGGGVGALSRQHGLVSDHLYAVEVNHVNAAGEVKTVVATRDAADANRDLWWAFAGGGGGNFGVVSRFWLRSPNVTSVKPQDQLPKRPQAIMTGRAIWNWADMDQVSFIQLLKNFGTWHEQYSAPGQRGNQLYASLIAPRKEAGKIFVSAQVDPADPANETLLNDFMTALTANVTPRATLINTGRQPWQYTTVNAADTAVAMGVTGPPRSRTKGALLRKRYTDEQAALIYSKLTSTTYSHTASSFSLGSFGGQINATAENASASVHRTAIMLASVFSCWDVPADDAKHQTWNREFYRDLYADTGGVPVPSDRYDGCFVNWPDPDLADPAWNTSGVPWTTLYYKGNYAKLQQVKAKYDPKDIFRHKLSVQLPA